MIFMRLRNNDGDQPRGASTDSSPVEMASNLIIEKKSDLTQLIIGVLAPYPHGLTTRQIVELTGMTSYNASAKLSKLRACSLIGKITIAGNQRHRWRVKAR